MPGWFAIMPWLFLILIFVGIIVAMVGITKDINAPIYSGWGVITDKQHRGGFFTYLDSNGNTLTIPEQWKICIESQKINASNCIVVSKHNYDRLQINDRVEILYSTSTHKKWVIKRIKYAKKSN